MSYAKQARDGFTLIEIMIAIAILGILAAVIAPSFFGYLKTARISSAKSTLQTMKSGITFYNAHTGQWPARLKDLIEKPRDEKLRKKWQGPYIEVEEIPEDPWGNAYQYKINPPGSARPYELFSYGPEGKGAPKEDWVDVRD